MSTQNAIADFAIGAHTNAVDAWRAAGAPTCSDAARASYTGAGGAGDDAFEYRRGSGASAVAFVFSMNAAYNGNAVINRAQVALDQLAYVEARLWPGKTRGAVEQQVSSLFGRGNIEALPGGYRLTERGVARARLMMADLGIAWPDDGAEVKPKKPKKAKKAKKATEAPSEPAEGTTYTLPRDDDGAPNQ